MSSKHPLLGTKDHVIPKSVAPGLRNNLKPAHRYCNQLKGNKELTDEEILACRSYILSVAIANKALAKEMSGGQLPVFYSKIAIRSHLSLAVRKNLAHWFAERSGFRVCPDGSISILNTTISFKSYYQVHRHAIWRALFDD